MRLPGNLRLDLDISFSNLLVLASVGATILSTVSPMFGNMYALHSYFLATGDYSNFIFQTLLFQFIHAGFGHLLGNSLGLLLFGNTVERIMGSARYAAFFVGSTVFVIVCLLSFSSGATVGISGFVMAVLAYLALELRAQKHPEFGGIFAMIIINIAIGFLPGISLVGHAAGAVFGVIAFFLPRIFRTNARR